MNIQLLRPVVLEIAEENARRIREIATDPANGITRPSLGFADGLIPTSPVPDIVSELDAKHAPVPNMPVSSGDTSPQDGNNKMVASATAGANPNDAQFWQAKKYISRHQDELRRILQRDAWRVREIAFIETQRAEAAMLYHLTRKRLDMRKIGEHLAFNDRMAQLAIAQRILSRDELEAYIALVNKDRLWIERVMSARADTPSIQINERNMRAQRLENEHLDLDKTQALQQTFEAVSRDLAAYHASSAYQATKKTG